MKSTFLFIAVLLLVIAAPAQKSEIQNQPLVISAVAPFYPPAALVINLQGDFFVDIEIDRSGKVVLAKALDTRRKFLSKTIETAASSWKFEANEKAEKIRRIRLTFTFKRVPDAPNEDSTTVFYPPYKIEVRENVVVKDANGLPLLENKPPKSKRQ